MLLKRFADQKNFMYVYNKKAPHIGFRHQHIDSNFFERYLYSSITNNGMRDAALEIQFSRKEGTWSSTIANIINAAKSGNNRFSPGDLANIGEFLYYQWIRTPDFIKQLSATQNADATLKRIIDTAVSEGTLTNDQRKELDDPEVLARIKQNSIVQALGNARAEALEVLKRSKFHIAVLTAGQTEFVIGSFPVVLVAGQGQAVAAKPKMELWLPIASDVAIYPDVIAGTTDIISMSDSRVVEINRAIARQSTLTGAKSRQTLAQIITL